MRRALAAATILLLLGVGACAPRGAGSAPSGAAGEGRVHVYLVVVDGLGAEQLDRALMPHLFDATLDPVAVRGEARAIMPTRTNPNHATLLTGLWPDGHGITGNAWWDRKASRPHKLEAAALFEAETLFTVAETTRPELVTVAAFSKAKLGRMFDTVTGRQRAPDLLWVPGDGRLAGRIVGLATDAETMDAFLALTAEQEPDLAVVNLSDVDQAGHRHGPGATAEARRQADAAIARLVADLRARGRWARSVLLVTADHGLVDVAPAPERAEPSVVLSRRFADAGIRGVQVAGDGGVAHVYAPPAVHGAGRETLLAWAAAVAWREPGVSEILARIPVPGVPLLQAAHPDWHLDHERSGDLLIVARPGWQLVDPIDSYTPHFGGNHGSPAEARIPLVVAGGALEPATTTLAAPPTTADIGATIAHLLRLRQPGRLDGTRAEPGKPLTLPLRNPR